MKMERQNIDMKPRILILIPILIIGLGFLPKAQALSPAPDGGYPGQNTAEGQSALLHLAGGTYNTALGWASLGFNVTGNYNTGVGAATLLNNTASENTATGAGALLSNTTGLENTANGAFALFSNTTAFSNTATGAGALLNNITGEGNTADGVDALVSNITGYTNTAIGDQALSTNTTGSNNTALGFGAGGNVTTANNVICIGTTGANQSNSCFIGRIFGATSSGGTAVFINSDGKLGTTTSSRRFKEEIEPMERASEVLFALKPVTFRYKKEIDPAGTSQFGLVAEEVEKVNPDLVVRDKEGKTYSVRYDQVNAMLLNEFLKEHRKVEQHNRKMQEQEATIAGLRSAIAQQRKDFETAMAQQQKQLQALTASLKEQAAQIQKVSAQIEVSTPTPQAVVDNQ
jgi:trimeric autotransporter adhesin